MKFQNKTFKLVVGAMMISLGVILPIFFHLLGLGKSFLPIHIPVIIGGIILGPFEGLIIGALSPILSSLITGMPPLMPPYAFLMMVELSIIGFLSGFIYRKYPKNIFIVILMTVISGRIVWGVVAWVFFPILGMGKISIFYPITAGIITCIPGLIIQILIIPIILGIIVKMKGNPS